MAQNITKICEDKNRVCAEMDC